MGTSARVRFSVFALGLLLAAGSSAAAPSKPKPFVDHLVERVVSRLSGDVPAETRAERFDALVDEYLAMDTISGFVTGPYWSEASPEQRAAFRDAFRELVRARFLPTLADAGDVTFDVGDTRRLREGLWAVRVVLQPDGGTEPVPVELRVMRGEDGLRVADIVTRGVSLGVTLREEYTSYLKRNDGDFDALTARVRAKVRELRE